MRHRSLPAYLALGVVAGLAVFGLAGGSLWAHVAIVTYFWAAVSTAWNILGGFAGQFSLGHASFFGAGAYASTLLFVKLGLSPWLGFLAGAVAGGALAVLVGLPTFRLRGPYFVLGSFALGNAAMLLAAEWRSLTGGPTGIAIGFRPGLANLTFHAKWPYMLLALGLLAACAASALLIARSKLGYQLAAIREDEDAAQALGIHTTRAKLVASAVSGALTGVLGAFHAQYVLFIDPPSVFGPLISLQVLLITMIGGLGTVVGPVLGAAIMVPITQVLLQRFGGSVAGLHTLLYGILVMVIVKFAPGGLVEALGARRPLRAREGGKAVAP